MEYRCEATSVAGFVQQLAVAYVGHGYFFYVTGEIPERKDPRVIDKKLIAKYGVAISKTARARRKAAGFANVQYIRFRRFFVIVATPGRHSFFDEESFIRDARDVPIKFGGYAISYRSGHPHVRIEQGHYLELKAYFAEIATHRAKDRLVQEFRNLRFEPYAPIRSQMRCLFREANKRRALAQFEEVPPSCLRVRRRVVRPFEVPQVVNAKAPPPDIAEDIATQ
jgi:hypothetical protein